jgi:hypothetical protein
LGRNPEQGIIQRSQAFEGLCKEAIGATSGSAVSRRLPSSSGLPHSFMAGLDVGQESTGAALRERMEQGGLNGGLNRFGRGGARSGLVWHGGGGLGAAEHCWQRKLEYNRVVITGVLELCVDATLGGEPAEIGLGQVAVIDEAVRGRVCVQGAMRSERVLARPIRPCAHQDGADACIVPAEGPPRCVIFQKAIPGPVCWVERGVEVSHDEQAVGGFAPALELAA